MAPSQPAATLVPPVHLDGFWLPRASSALANETDVTFATVATIALVIFALAMLAIVVMLARTPAKNHGKPPAKHLWLQVLMPAVFGAIAINLFFAGWTNWVHAAVAPGDALVVQALAKDWSWEFTYPSGIKSDDKLVVPMGKPIKLILSSTRPTVTLSIPEFRIKQDAVAGAYTSVWFTPNTLGETAIFNSQFVGVLQASPSSSSKVLPRADMVAILRVIAAKDFDDWIANGGRDTSLPPAAMGAKIYKDSGCNACHSTDGSRITGPTFKGVYGRKEQLEGGGEIVVDDAYIKESVQFPAAKIVKGYPNVMPSFKTSLADWQIDSVIAFLKEQK